MVGSPALQHSAYVLTELPPTPPQIKLALPEGEVAPDWVAELVDSGACLSCFGGVGWAFVPFGFCGGGSSASFCFGTPPQRHTEAPLCPSHFPPLDAPPATAGLLTEVHKFSKFIHGTATLFPDMVQAVPYWVDDESGEQ